MIIYAGLGGRGRHNHSGEVNWYFAGFGILLLIPFFVHLLKTKLTSRKANKEKDQRIKFLKQNGDKIIIELEELIIQSNNYKKEVLVGSGTNKRLEDVYVNHNVILFDITYKNRVLKFRIDIDIELSKLKMYFTFKEKTNLYIDSENPSNNYLDLTFLENEKYEIQQII